jgi:hypothetical protein
MDGKIYGIVFADQIMGEDDEGDQEEEDELCREIELSIDINPNQARRS